MGENQSKKVSLPLTKASAASLHAGDVVSLTGVMYSAIRLIWQARLSIISDRHLQDQVK